MADYIYLLQTRLTPYQQSALEHVRQVAKARAMTVFLVGGAVRDLTSGSPIRDLDFAVQGNATKLKKELQKAGGVVIGEDEPTQTLYFTFPGGVRLEVGSTLSATYASEGTRESALAVSRAVQYHAHRRVELPAGATIVRVPGPFDVQTRALAASRKLRVTTGASPAIEDDVTLGVPTGTVPAAGYAGFVADAHRTYDALLATTHVRMGAIPTPPKPAP